LLSGTAAPKLKEIARCPQHYLCTQPFAFYARVPAWNAFIRGTDKTLPFRKRIAGWLLQKCHMVFFQAHDWTQGKRF
jgi:hypothetical protein